MHAEEIFSSGSKRMQVKKEKAFVVSQKPNKSRRNNTRGRINCKRPESNEKKNHFLCALKATGKEEKEEGKEEDGEAEKKEKKKRRDSGMERRERRRRRRRGGKEVEGGGRGGVEREGRGGKEIEEKEEIIRSKEI